MKWQMQSWEKPATCVVTFEGTDSVEIVMKMTDIPENDKFSARIHVDSITQGWQEMIFKRIHQVFGYPLRRD